MVIHVTHPASSQFLIVPLTFPSSRRDGARNTTARSLCAESTVAPQEIILGEAVETPDCDLRNDLGTIETHRLLTDRMIALNRRLRAALRQTASTGVNAVLAGERQLSEGKQAIIDVIRAAGHRLTTEEVLGAEKTRGWPVRVPRRSTLLTWSVGSSCRIGKTSTPKATACRSGPDRVYIPELGPTRIARHVSFSCSCL